MATTKKAAAAPEPPKPVSPADALAAATAKVRAPFEAIRAAQAKAETKGD